MVTNWMGVEGAVAGLTAADLHLASEGVVRSNTPGTPHPPRPSGKGKVGEQPRADFRYTESEDFALYCESRQFSDDWRRKYAQEGVAMPDGSYPIQTQTPSGPVGVASACTERYGRLSPTDRAAPERRRRVSCRLD